MSALTRLYPPAWRARYGAEFEALLEERTPTARDLVDIVVGAIDARLSPQVASAPVMRRARLTERLAGAAAIAGGLTWSATFLAAWPFQAGGDLSLPIFAALGLMLLSLPGTYLVAYARPVVLGSVALVGGFAVIFAEVLPWGPLLLLPIVAIIATIGPGALALAAARARVGTRARWRLLLLTTPWPVIGGFALLSGLVLESIALPLFAILSLPLGIAWIATGVRLSRSVAIDASASPPTRPTSTIATAGGAA